MAIRFDNPTHVNGLVIVAFESDAAQTVSLDASTYMNEIYTVVANPITAATTVAITQLATDEPFPMAVPIFAEWAGTTVTLKQANTTAGTTTTTITPATTGVIIGRK